MLKNPLDTLDSIESLPYGLQSLKVGQGSEKKLTTCDGTAFYGSNSFLSNFYPSEIAENNLIFPTSEHFFQYKKALYFQDAATASAIYKAHTPKQAKTLSHQIKDFDRDLWETVASQYMLKACTMKFQQNEALGLKLKQTTGILVEANPKDSYFSCGLSLQDPNLDNATMWKGQNILGDILIKVRDSLKS